MSGMKTPGRYLQPQTLADDRKKYKSPKKEMIDSAHKTDSG